MTAQIQSRYIFGATCTPETAKELRKTVLKGKPQGEMLQFMVMQTSVGHKTHYVCLSGGRLDKDGQPEFTAIGAAALDALMNLPYEHTGVVFAECKLGPTPLKEKIIKIILEAPEGAAICFVGDIHKELDGHLTPCFNMTGTPIFLPGMEGLKDG